MKNLNRIQAFSITGEIAGPAYIAAVGVPFTNTTDNFYLMSSFVWPRDLDIVSWQFTYEGYSSVLGPNQNLIAAIAVGVNSLVFGINSAQGSNTFSNSILAVLDGAPTYYPAGVSSAGTPPQPVANSPAISVQSGDLSMTYPDDQRYHLAANCPISLYGALSAGTIYDDIFAAFVMNAVESPT
jgi:hypothetical protein